MMSYGWLMILIIMVCFVIIAPIYLIDSIYSEKSNAIRMNTRSISRKIYTSKDRKSYIIETWTPDEGEWQRFIKTGEVYQPSLWEIKSLCNSFGMECDLEEEDVKGESV